MTTPQEYHIDGKTVVLTGATHGIGRATADGLAKAGADLVLACRDTDTAGKVRAEISALTGNTAITVVKLDLASLASIRAAAEEIRRLRDRIDILINNAGTFNMKRRLTEDGFEMTMGVNHLGHFLLTHELIPALARSPQARIINVASDANLHGKIDFDNFFLETRYASFKAYASSRLATVLFTQELSERLKSKGITANSLHPGHVATNIWDLWPKRKLLKRVLRSVMARFLLSEEEGAITSLYLACTDEVAGVTGQYFDECRPARVNPLCADRTLQERLWKVSAELTGV